MKAVIIAVALFVPSAAVAQQLAFPGAEGYGRFASGGRGGVVYHVTTLADSGAGSFRSCIEATGARTCVFDVGGEIMSLGAATSTPPGSAFTVTNPDLTIAGETAPPPGITLKRDPVWDGDALSLRAGNIIVRYITFEAGRMTGLGANDPPDGKSATRDGMEVGQFNTNFENMILDHVSGRYGVDEIITVYSKSATIQNSLFGWGLRSAGHEKGAHSKGILATNLNADAGLSLIRSVWAHASDRMPNLENYRNYQIVNTIFYNAGTQFSEFRNRDNAQNVFGPGRVNWISSICKIGPNTDPSPTPKCVDHAPSDNPYPATVNGPNRFYFYVTDSLCTGGTCNLIDPVDNDGGANDQRIATPNPDQPPIGTVWSSATLEATLLPVVGRTLPMRDETDRVLVEEIQNGTGQILDMPLIAVDSPINDPHALAVPLAQTDAVLASLVASCTASPEACSSWQWADHDRDGLPNLWEERHASLDPHNPADGATIAPSGYSYLEEYLHTLAARSPL